jgi:uncharacterized protein (DUF169 family)
MNSAYKKQSIIIRKYLGIEKIISIRFSNEKTTNFKKFKDTACTALARSLKNNILTYLDRKNGQLCPGGDYFLNIAHPPKKEIYDVYVKKEKVFQNNAVANAFIKNLPPYPSIAEKRYILLTPLNKEKNKPDIIMFLANPAQAGRVLGLSAYKKISCPLVMSALSTCASIYAPIESNNIHLNFIDYYDRYHQGKQKGRLFWEDSDLIISMPFGIFKEVIKCIPLSAQGSYKPKLEPQKVDHL